MRCQNCGCWNDDPSVLRSNIAQHQPLIAGDTHMAQLQFEQQNLIANQFSQITQPCRQVSARDPSYGPNQS
jgi:hypothetical protein